MSIKSKLFIVMIIGLVVSVGLFTAIWNLGNFLIWRYYLNSEKTVQRNESYLEEFQNYVNENKLSTNDEAEIRKWTDKRYTELVIYKDGALICTPEWFVSEDESAEGEDSDTLYNDIISGERGFEQYLTEESRTRYEKALQDILDQNTDMTAIRFTDGRLLVAVIDYSEKFVKGVVLAVSIGIAFIVFAVIMALCFTHITSRVTKLAHDINRVEKGEINGPIVFDGNDEIATLASDVNMMRSAIIENMSRENRAWEANVGLITAMSHDIRTPLTVLLGYIDLMEIQNEDPVMSEYIQSCRENALRLKKLSDDLFSYFLVFGKKDFDLNIERCTVNELLRHMVEEHVILLTEKGQHVIQHWPEENSEFLADTVYLGRVIDNIFSNIGKYSDKDADVDINVYCENDRVCAEFKNKVGRIQGTESNEIGIKTCVKIMEQMGGGFEYFEDGNIFTVKVILHPAGMGQTLVSNKNRNPGIQ